MKTKSAWIVLALAVLAALPACRKEPASEAGAGQQVADAEKKVADAQKQLAEAQKQAEEARSQAAANPSSTASGAGQSGRGGPASPAKGAAAAPAAPQSPVLKPVTIPAGAQIVVRTTVPLSTKTAQNGERFEATLAKDLVADGVTVAATGADVEGVVVQSDPGGRVKGVASLAIALRSLNTKAGKVEIQTGAFGAQARSSVKKDLTKGAIMTGVGAAIGAIAGGGKGAAVGAGIGAGAGAGTAAMTRGDPAVIPAESVLTFQLKAPVTLTLK